MYSKPKIRYETIKKNKRLDDYAVEGEDETKDKKVYGKG